MVDAATRRQAQPLAGGTSVCSSATPTATNASTTSQVMVTHAALSGSCGRDTTIFAPTMITPTTTCTKTPARPPAISVMVPHLPRGVNTAAVAAGPPQGVVGKAGS